MVDRGRTTNKSEIPSPLLGSTNPIGVVIMKETGVHTERFVVERWFTTNDVGTALRWDLH